jgi:cobalt-zinc-cadmium efflux system protein
MNTAHETTTADCGHAHRPITEHHSSHDHEHHHEVHTHRPGQRRALLVCVILTAGMMVAEFIAGWLTGSLMLISDAIHMLSHAAALTISLFAVTLAHRTAGQRFPFGLYRVEILAALLNGIGLAIFSVWIVYEGVIRIIHPVAILGPELTLVALVGLVVNLATAAILLRAGVEDLNTRSAFLHMLGDTISSVAIVAGGVIIVYTGWTIVDPLLSMLVAVLVARWSWGLLKDSVLVLLERAPDDLDTAALERGMKNTFPHVRDVHDIHAWEITSQFTCLTMHVVLEDRSLGEAQSLRHQLAEYLQHHHGIAHVVIQLET